MEQKKNIWLKDITNIEGFASYWKKHLQMFCCCWYSCMWYDNSIKQFHLLVFYFHSWHKTLLLFVDIPKSEQSASWFSYHPGDCLFALNSISIHRLHGTVSSISHLLVSDHFYPLQHPLLSFLISLYNKIDWRIRNLPSDKIKHFWQHRDNSGNKGTQFVLDHHCPLE